MLLLSSALKLQVSSSQCPSWPASCTRWPPHRGRASSRRWGITPTVCSHDQTTPTPRPPNPSANGTIPPSSLRPAPRHATTICPPLPPPGSPTPSPRSRPLPVASPLPLTCHLRPPTPSVSRPRFLTPALLASTSHFSHRLDTPPASHTGKSPRQNVRTCGGPGSEATAAAETPSGNKLQEWRGVTRLYSVHRYD